MTPTDSSHPTPAEANGTLFPPSVFIIGAPKCGTTALAEYLADHPEIAFSRPKEPHYYSDDLGGLRRATDDEGYRPFFKPTAQTKLLMEASVWYLYSQTAIPAILAARPDARFIVMLRNPVKMLPSLHLQLINALDEDQEDFRTAWNLSDQRMNGQSIPKSCRAPSTLIYTQTAAYGEMLTRLFAHVARDRCLVLFQEDMAKDTAATYRTVLSFLGVSDDGRQDFPIINQAVRSKSRAVRYILARGKPFRQLISKPIKALTGKQSLGVVKGLGKWNDVAAGALDIAPETLDAVGAHYASDVTRLGEILGRDMAAMGWRTKA